jgi:hypothetical protein
MFCFFPAFQFEYYVHYEGFNRRLDEWVKRDRIRVLEEENGEVMPG